MRRTLTAAAALLVLAGCADQQVTTHINAAPSLTDPQTCAAYTAADVTAARRYVRAQGYKKGDIEPFVVLATSLDPKAMIVMRVSGITVVTNGDYEGPDLRALEVLLQQGDSARGDFIEDDHRLQDVTLIAKKAITPSTSTC